MNLSQAIANRFNVYQHWQYEYNDSEWFPVKCPLHQDESASAGLNFHSKMFNCFSPDCGSMPFWKLAKHLEIEFNEIDETNDNFENWLDNLLEDQTKSRPMVLRKQVEAFVNFCLERKLDPKTIEECGGYYCSDESNLENYGHLIFEYGKDKYGKAKTIKRRILGEGERFRQSSNQGNEDSKALFGKDFTSRDTIVLVEGVTDYLTLWQRGTKTYSIAASFGAKLSKQQAYLLRNKTIFILYDRDYDGSIGATKAKELLQEWKCNVHILEIPDRFASEKYGYKIDVNSAYCVDEVGFFEWLDTELSRYSIFDSYYVSEVFNPNSTKDKLLQFRTGINTLDQILNGGFAAGIHGIAGRSGIGKSSVISEIIDQAASQGMMVLPLSYELSKRQMWSRLASRYSIHSFGDIEKDNSILEESAYKKVSELSSKVKIELGWNIDQVISSIEHCDVAIIDYIQRMEYEGDTRKGIDLNMGKLSNLARDKNKIIIIISSMAEGQDNFKESGSILYMCQSAFFLKKIQHDTLMLENVKNTRGISGKNIFLNIDYAHQRVKETNPPNIDGIIGR